MAQQTEKSTSHLGFFVAILAIALACWAAWRFVGNSYFTTQQQAETAAVNPGMPQRHRDKEPRADAPKAEKPAAEAGAGE